MRLHRLRLSHQLIVELVVIRILQLAFPGSCATCRRRGTTLLCDAGFSSLFHPCVGLGLNGRLGMATCWGLALSSSVNRVAVAFV